MNIALIEIKHSGDNKDYNGGFGTTFDIKGSLGSWILRKVRRNYENFPTISYAYISSIFKKYNHFVTYYKNELPEDCDIALINCTTIRYSEEIKVINELKNSFKCKVGVFGVLPTINPELYKTADFIICGEQENVIENIAKTGKIPEGVIQAGYVEKPEDLPFPDWDIFDINKFSYSPLLSGKPFTFMKRSRGCPYSCGYCPHKVFGKFRVRPLDSVIKEIEYLKSKYNVNTIHFRDSCFFLNNEEANNIAKAFNKNNINVNWGFETRLDLLNKNILDTLYSVGLRAIKVGVENASMRRLIEHGRVPPDLTHAKEIIAYCNVKGIRSNACYIIGFPDENVSDIKETVKLAKSINTTFANFFILTPLPGTRFGDNEKIIIDKKWEHRDNFHLVFDHKNFKPDELRKLQRKAIVNYYFRPKLISSYFLNKFK